MALPRVLSLAQDGSLKMEFAPQVDALAERSHAVGIMTDQTPKGWYTRQLERLKLENLSSQLRFRSILLPFAFELRDRSNVWLSISLGAPVDGKIAIAVNQLRAEVPFVDHLGLDLRLFLDGSVAELICDQQHAFTARVYRLPDGPLTLKFLAERELPCLSCEWSQMRRISKDRLTT